MEHLGAPFLFDNFHEIAHYKNVGNPKGYMKKFTEFTQLKEFNFARLFQHLENRNVGVITAFRSRYPKNENRARNKQLESKIRQAGYGFTRASGHYIEGFGTDSAIDSHEEVFIIVGDLGDDKGKLKGLLKKWGKEFQQDSVLYKHPDTKSAVLIGTQSHDEDGNTVEFPGMGKEVGVGSWHPSKMGQFYTKMRGKSFVFESAKFPPSIGSEMAKARIVKD